MRITIPAAALLTSLALLPACAGDAPGAGVAEAPRSAAPAEQTKDAEKDRVIQPKDKLTLSIDDLEALNRATVVKLVVDENGKINLPHVKEPVKATGLTCEKLEQAIVTAYREAKLIHTATVKVVFTKQPKS